MKKSISLICTVCLSRNYHKVADSDKNVRLELNKYCSKCNCHTLHKASK